MFVSSCGQNTDEVSTYILQFIVTRQFKVLYIRRNMKETEGKVKRHINRV